MVRVWVYREHIVWRPALVMLLGALPATIASARLYVALPADVIAVILGLFLLSSVPLRRFMESPTVNKILSTYDDVDRAALSPEDSAELIQAAVRKLRDHEPARSAVAEE